VQLEQRVLDRGCRHRGQPATREPKRLRDRGLAQCRERRAAMRRADRDDAGDERRMVGAELTRRDAGRRVGDDEQLRARPQLGDSRGDAGDLLRQRHVVAAAVVGEVGGVEARDAGRRGQVDGERIGALNAQVEVALVGRCRRGAGVARDGGGDERIPACSLGERRMEQQHGAARRCCLPRVDLVERLVDQLGVTGLLVVRDERNARSERPVAVNDALRHRRHEAVAVFERSREVVESRGEGFDRAALHRLAQRCDQRGERRGRTQHRRCVAARSDRGRERAGPRRRRTVGVEPEQQLALRCRAVADERDAPRIGMDAAAAQRRQRGGDGVEVGRRSGPGLQALLQPRDQSRDMRHRLRRAFVDALR
jgi:hypothetical protein